MSKRVLVVDDDQAVRRAFELALRGLDYDVVLAPSGEEGVSAARDSPPDIVFLDLRMPGMNGVEVLRALRSGGLECPIIIVTAFHKEFLDQLIEVRKEAIAFELLQKPMDRKQIIKVTQAFLNHDVIAD